MMFYRIFHLSNLYPLHTQLGKYVYSIEKVQLKNKFYVMCSKEEFQIRLFVM